MFTDPAKQVGWVDENTQKLRYLMLTQIADLNGCSVLDVGCGLGDLSTYLTDQGLEIQYEGIDMTSEMIERAKLRHPGTAFFNEDFFSETCLRRADYMLASGAFSIRLPEGPSAQEHYLQEGIAKLFKLAHQGVAFNLLSRQSPDGQVEPSLLYYYDPATVLNYCFKHTDYVSCHHHYLAKDMTFYLYK